jgi:hypothetical protein
MTDDGDDAGTELDALEGPAATDELDAAGEEPDEYDALDWAAADVTEEAYASDEHDATEVVADGSQDMVEEEAGWAEPFNQPRGEWRAV